MIIDNYLDISSMSPGQMAEYFGQKEAGQVIQKEVDHEGSVFFWIESNGVRTAGLKQLAKGGAFECNDGTKTWQANHLNDVQQILGEKLKFAWQAAQISEKVHAPIPPVDNHQLLLSQLKNKPGFKNPCQDQRKLKIVLQQAEIGHLDKANKTEELILIYSPNFALLKKEQQASINEFLRRVNKYELVYSLVQMNQLPPLKGEELTALKKQDWSHPIFQNPNLQMYTLKELISGSLDVSEASEIFIYDECTHWIENKDKTITLPISKPSSLDASTEISKISTKELLKQSTKRFYTDAEIENFLKDPDIQQSQIYAVPIPAEAENFFDTSVMTIVSTAQPFLVYPLKKEDDEVRYQIIMSPKLMGKLYAAKYGKQAPAINPVIGPSVSFANFKDAKRRDSLVPSSHLFPESQQQVADKFYAPPEAAWVHDAVFHTHIECSIPVSHREAYNELALMFEKQPNFKAYKEIHAKLHDKQFREYQYRSDELPPDPNKAFKKTLVSRVTLEDDAVDLMLAYVKDHQEEWEKKYGIVYPKSLHEGLIQLRKDLPLPYVAMIARLTELNAL